MGKQKAQALPAPLPLPAPAPVPVAADPNPSETADQRRKRLAELKKGIASTVKTGPQGITGAGPELNTPAATAGSMFPSMKETLG
jgi:hypothetical protein